MEQEELDDLVRALRRRRSDTTSVEVKAAREGCPRLTETLCAFGNMPEGGLIILGLDESEGFAPVGLSNLGTLEQGVASQAREGVTPPVAVEFAERTVDGQPVLLVTVTGLPLQDRPARTARGAFLRQSDGDYAMSDQEVAYIERQKAQAFQRDEPDRAPLSGADLADLDPDLLAAFVANARTQSRRLRDRDDTTILTWLGVINNEGVPTLAGDYALGVYPQRHSPMLGITAAVKLPRGSGARVRDLVHLDGPIPDLLDDALSWVVRNTRTSVGYAESGHGRDITELPMRAVREIIANALVHRDLSPLSRNKSVEIRLTDDRLIIASPGGLWGVAEQQLGHPGGKSAVNPSLYDICRLTVMPDRTRVIEGEGGGIREAMAALRDAGLQAMVFIDKGVSFTVIISRHTLLDAADIEWLTDLPGAETLSSEQRAILASMRSGQAWTNSMVREHFPPTDADEARRVLRRLVDLGFAEQHGARGGTTYVLAPSVGGKNPRGGTLFDAVAQGATASREVTEDDIAAVTRLGLPVWQTLDRPRTRKEVVAALSITPRQAQHALERLREAGYVELAGGSGNRDSRYRRR